jgi:hypothetical protein
MYPSTEVKITHPSKISLNELKKFILNYIDGSREISFFRIKCKVSDLTNDKQWHEILDEVKNYEEDGFSLSFNDYSSTSKLIESINIRKNYSDGYIFEVSLSDLTTIREYQKILKEIDYVCKKRRGFIDKFLQYRFTNDSNFILFILPILVAVLILLFLWYLLKWNFLYLNIIIIFTPFIIDKIGTLIQKNFNKRKFIFVLNAIDKNDIFGRPLDGIVVYFLKQNMPGIFIGMALMFITLLLYYTIRLFIPNYDWPI